MIDDYFRDVTNTLRSSRLIRAHDVVFDKRDPETGYIRGNVFFADGSLLHFRELVNTETGVERFSYTYHYQKADGTFVLRYDDSEHYPNLPDFPHHKHVGDESNVTSAPPPDLESVIREVESLIGFD